MTDKSPTERLREMLDEFEYECFMIRVEASETRAKDDGVRKAYERQREETVQAIAATLGADECAKCAEDMGVYADSLCDSIKERLDKLLRCLKNDWHISASWDGLRKFWCIELTEEGVRMRDGTLTAEQVREVVEKHWHDLPTEYDMPEASALPEYSYNWHAIADELNATLCCGTCRNKMPSDYWRCGPLETCKHFKPKEAER